MKKIALTTPVSQHCRHHAFRPLNNPCNTISRDKKSLSFFCSLLKLTRRRPQALLSILCCILILPLTANAHKGAKGEIDTCRILVDKEMIHFSAYTPLLSKGKSFCHIIPQVGLTDLVIDYEGTKLRHTTVEFELTKEPEGSRVYYHKPEQIRKGTINAKVDFRKHGKGNYLLHVTVLNEGETIDSHLPFSVGIKQAESTIPNSILFPFMVVIVILAIMFYLSRAGKKQRSSDNAET